jgi:hypothetical protein
MTRLLAAKHLPDDNPVVKNVDKEYLEDKNITIRPSMKIRMSFMGVLLECIDEKSITKGLDDPFHSFSKELEKIRNINHTPPIAKLIIPDKQYPIMEKYRKSNEKCLKIQIWSRQQPRGSKLQYNLKNTSHQHTGCHNRRQKSTK